jgi:hypothetical protein
VRRAEDHVVAREEPGVAVLVDAHGQEHVEPGERVDGGSRAALTAELLGDRHLDLVHEHRHTQPCVQLARQRQPVVLDAHPPVICDLQRVAERLALRAGLARRVELRPAEFALLPVTPDVLVDPGQLECERHQLPRLSLIARVEQDPRDGGQIKRRVAGRDDGRGLTDQRFDVHGPTVSRAARR